MGVVESFTKDRMLQIENTTVVGGFVDANGKLLLETREGQEIDAGSVVGPQGPAVYLLGVAYPWMADGPVPEWSLELNGQAVSRTTYSALFALWGTKYGAGDGSTTFNVPDWRGKTVAGQNTTGIFNAAIGTVVGAETHQLTIPEMPSHTHVQNSHNHTQNSHAHTIPRHDTGADQTSGGNRGYVTSGGNSPLSTAATTAVNQATTATNQNTGGGGAHNNVQPTAIVRWIVCAVSGTGAFNTEVETMLTHRVVKASEDAQSAREDVDHVQSQMTTFLSKTGSTRPGFHVSLSANQSVSGVQQTPILNLDSVIFNNGGYSTAARRYTCPDSGFYMVSAEAVITSAVGGPEIYAYVNGVIQSFLRAIGYGVAYQTFGFTHPVFLNAGDVLDLRVRNNNGTSFTLDAARTFFSAIFLG